TPLQTPKQTLLPGTAHRSLPRTVQMSLPGSGENSMYRLPTPSDYSSGHESVTPNEVKPRMPSPYMDFFMMSYGKWEREDFALHFHGGGYIPQQDGVGDGAYDVFQKEVPVYYLCQNIYTIFILIKVDLMCSSV
ncbi:hypothetical protein IFM89_027098, partial [Coptis chinensis]